MKRIITAVCLLVVLIVSPARAAFFHVPEDYTTIQAALNSCEDYDTVVIAQGRYTGDGNRNINFNGKLITVRSTDPTDINVINSTVIDCQSNGHGFVFNRGENPEATVAGLTITGGYASLGGAIYCYNNSSPSITNCLIIDNLAFLGGGVAFTNSETRPRITNCILTTNSALVGGGAIYCNGASPKISNCLITSNQASDGGAVYSHNPGDPLISNCTVSGNAAFSSAGAIYCYKSSNLVINNSILWGNTAAYAPEVLVDNLGATTSIHISYCDVQDYDNSVISDNGCTVNWGSGNIDIDPYFVSMGLPASTNIHTGGDYHLLKGSACIDAGDPAFTPGPDETDIDGNPRTLGEKVDIGADEYLPPIPAFLEIKPKTLNLGSCGNWIRCIIALPESYYISQIITDSIILNEKVKPVWYETDEEARKLVAKFNRSQVQNTLNTTQGPAVLTVSGKLSDGMDFEGNDTVRVVRPAGKK